MQTKCDREDRKTSRALQLGHKSLLRAARLLGSSGESSALIGFEAFVCGLRASELRAGGDKRPDPAIIRILGKGGRRCQQESRVYSRSCWPCLCEIASRMQDLK